MTIEQQWGSQFAHLMPGFELEQLKELMTRRPSLTRLEWAKAFKKMLRACIAITCKEWSQDDWDSSLEELERFLTRRPDAWEIKGNTFIWCELDGAHPTEAGKFEDVGMAADYLINYGIRLVLWVYDVRSHQTIYFDTGDLARESFTVMSMLDAKLIHQNNRFPVRINATSRSYGMDLSMLENL